jgi:hypothetical protein
MSYLYNLAFSQFNGVLYACMCVSVVVVDVQINGTDKECFVFTILS